MQTWLISLRCFLSGAILLATLQCIAAEPTTRPLPRLETGMHIDAINRIATDVAGRWTVTASDDKTARVWEVASGRQLAVLRPPQDIGDEGQLAEDAGDVFLHSAFGDGQPGGDGGVGAAFGHQGEHLALAR